MPDSVRLAVFPKRLVKVALVEKKSVEVALVVVEFKAVKSCKVVEPLIYAAPSTSRRGPVVVVAVPPKTRAISVPPLG